MRYVEDHRRQTHSRIVENASYGLRQKGAKGLSVVDLMKLAGLTHGGFYNHFEFARRACWRGDRFCNGPND